MMLIVELCALLEERDERVKNRNFGMLPSLFQVNTLFCVVLISL